MVFHLFECDDAIKKDGLSDSSLDRVCTEFVLS